jgi:hypothetical protein
MTSSSTLWGKFEFLNREINPLSIVILFLLEEQVDVRTLKRNCNETPWLAALFKIRLPIELQMYHDYIL